MSPQSDQRKIRRQTCVVPVDAKRGTPFSCLNTIDINKNGVGFVSRKPVRVDEAIAVQVDLAPDAEPVILMGRVKWSKKIPGRREYRVGMKFTNVVASGSRGRMTEHFGEE